MIRVDNIMCHVDLRRREEKRREKRGELKRREEK